MHVVGVVRPGLGLLLGLVVFQAVDLGAAPDSASARVRMSEAQTVEDAAAVVAEARQRAVEVVAHSDVLAIVIPPSSGATTTTVAESSSPPAPLSAGTAADLASEPAISGACASIADLAALFPAVTNACADVAQLFAPTTSPAVLPPAPAPAPAATPTSDRDQYATLLITPTSGPPGTMVRAIGSCPLVSYGHQDGDHALSKIDMGNAEVTSTGDGRFVANLQIPSNARPGVRQVNLSCRYRSPKPEFEVEREFFITSGSAAEAGNAVISPMNGPAGTVVAVAGKCPTLSESGEALRAVRVNVDRVGDWPAVTAHFTPDGKFAAMATIPQTAVPGTASVRTNCIYGTDPKPDFIFRNEFRITAG